MITFNVSTLFGTCLNWPAEQFDHIARTNKRAMKLSFTMTLSIIW